MPPARECANRVVFAAAHLAAALLTPGGRTLRATKDREMCSMNLVISTRAGLTILALAGALGNGGEPASDRTARPGPAPHRRLDTYAALPVAFVENRGQMDARVRYEARERGFAFYLTGSGMTLTFAPAEAHGGASVALRFIGANARAQIRGEHRAPGEVNYFIGNAPDAWRTRMPRYFDVVYEQLWPHIDLRVRENAGVLKYQFHVHPGGRVSDIRLAYDGASQVAIDAAGALIVDTSIGRLRDAAPTSYQQIDGRSVPVESRFVMHDITAFGFSASAYRPDRELIVDPGIAYTTFLGGSSHEIGASIAVDASGNAYITGTTQSPDFPVTAGAFDRSGAVSNSAEAFVTKINASGTALVYSTFIGGSDMEFGRRIALDATGNAYITGQTKSSNFPVTGAAFDRTLNVPPNCPRCATDNTDGFVTKLNATGSALVYSTYLGGTEYDSPRGIAVDAGGRAYITGETLSPDFPTTTGAFRRSYSGNYDIFVTKLNASGSTLAYSTFIGGTQVDNAERVAVDSSGNAYVLGFSSSLDFPTTAGAFNRTNKGGFDVTVTKLNPSGSLLIYSTYLGGQGSDTGGGLVVDDEGQAYVAGGTGSLDFPVTAGAFRTPPDGSDVFVTKLNAAGTALVYSSVFGGTASEGANGIDLDAAGTAWITGVTSSTDYPTTGDASDRTANGMADVFITQLNAAGAALIYSTLQGGSQSDVGNDIAVDGIGDVYVTGHTYSLNFPVTAGAFDRTWNGDTSIFWGDAFVTKIDVSATASTDPAPPGTPAAPLLVSPSNADSPPQPITFDWNAAADAASYTIQIDDSSGFTAPLVREANVTDTIYATSGLAATTHFWRVRGINTAGAPGPWSPVRSFTPQAAPPPAALGSIDVNPATVIGGDLSSGTVVLSAGAPDGGAIIALSSSNPSIASVPASATAPSNSFTATFTIASSAVTSRVVVTITASYNGGSRSATLTVTPPGSSSSTLTNLAVSPASVAGGSTAQGAVVLSAAAATATTVALASDNGAVAAVPPSVTVAAGSQSAVFTISTTATNASTPVTIAATLNGVTKSATLTVTPDSPPPPPPPPPSTAVLTVTGSGRSGERITSTPSGISVATGSSGSASFAVGTSVRLTVSNGRSAIWSGACSSGGNKTTSCTFTLNAAASVSANVQ